jgi:phosphohistidine phosphatase
MKVLLLLRHADSSEKVQGQSDKERSLTRKGMRQAEAVASFMKAKELLPTHIIASSSERVRATVDIVMKRAASDAKTEFTDELNEADVETYLGVIRRAADCHTLLVAGHNPAITAFATYISRTKVNGLGTGNLLVFHFKENSWTQLAKGVCELMEHFAPQGE